MRDLLSRGIGVHHGGLLPIVKEVCGIFSSKSKRSSLALTKIGRGDPVCSGSCKGSVRYGNICYGKSLNLNCRLILSVPIGCQYAC